MPQIPKLSCAIILIFGLLGCESNVQPKQKAFLALEYQSPSYQLIKSDCPFQFEINQIAKIETPQNFDPCSFNIRYPKLGATIFFTYKPIHNNLKSLLTDAQKLPLKHTIKADAIEADIYTNDVAKTYGNFYEVEGDAASQAQFYLTDSLQHFVTGSIYFKTAPNYDSILPAASYIKNDLKHIVESMRWK